MRKSNCYLSLLTEHYTDGPLVCNQAMMVFEIQEIVTSHHGVNAN